MISVYSAIIASTAVKIRYCIIGYLHGFCSIFCKKATAPVQDPLSVNWLLLCRNCSRPPGVSRYLMSSERRYFPFPFYTNGESRHHGRLKTSRQSIDCGRLEILQLRVVDRILISFSLLSFFGFCFLYFRDSTERRNVIFAGQLLLYPRAKLARSERTSSCDWPRVTSNRQEMESGCCEHERRILRYEIKFKWS